MKETKEASALLIQISGHPGYLLPEDSLPQLTEFCRSFSGEIHEVSIPESVSKKILPIDKLPSRLCDADYCLDVPFKTVKKVFPATESPTILKVKMPGTALPRRFAPKTELRAMMAEIARQQFMENEIVSYSSVNDEVVRRGFPEGMPELSPSQLANMIQQMISIAKGSLMRQGRSFERVSVGRWKMLPLAPAEPEVTAEPNPN